MARTSGVPAVLESCSEAVLGCEATETLKDEPNIVPVNHVRGRAVNRYDRIVAGVAIASATVAIFVVGLYSSSGSFWLAPGLVVSLSALMFGGIVVLPWARKTRSAIPDRVIQYLFALVLTSAIVIMLVAMVILGVGFFIWLRFGEYDRVAFAIAEGAPFLLLTIVLSIASFGLLRVRLWAWWQALLGSVGAIAHGIYRYHLSAAFIPGNASPVTWFSSNPGGWLTMVLGSVVLVQLIAAFRFFRQRATTAVSSTLREQIANYLSPHSTREGSAAEATPRPVSPPTAASASRWDSPRLEIGVGGVLLAFFAFVQAVNVYEYLIGAVNFPVVGLTVFFILWGIGLIVHGVLRRRRADQRPPFPGHAALSQVVSGAPGSQLMACPRCGATVNAANRFCPNCRFQLRQ